jgi:hypothetical protein
VEFIYSASHREGGSLYPLRWKIVQSMPESPSGCPRCLCLCQWACRNFTSSVVCHCQWCPDAQANAGTNDHAIAPPPTRKPTRPPIKQPTPRPTRVFPVATPTATCHPDCRVRETKPVREKISCRNFASRSASRKPTLSASAERAGDVVGVPVNK